MLTVFPQLRHFVVEAEEPPGPDGPRGFLLRLLRSRGVWPATLAVALFSIGFSVVCGLILTPWFIGPVTRGTVLFTIAIPALVAPPIIYLTMLLLYELDVAERRLQKLSITDDLTDAFNRRFLLHALDMGFAHSRRYGGELSLLMIDIDHFKRVNDRYGHQVGDLALIETVRRIASCLRDVDVLARYGGEEFVAMLPNTAAEGAYTLAERVRKAVGESPLHLGPRDLAATISIGVATLRDSDQDVENLLRRSDQALYRAKEQGRDRVIVG